MAAAMYPSVERGSRRRAAPAMDKYNGVAFSLSMEESGGEEGCEGGQVAFLDTDQSDSEGPASPQPNNAWLGSAEFSGSRGKGSWGGKGGGGGRRCVGCLLCFFLLSTSGLGAVLLLLYTGHIALAPRNSAHGAATSIDLLPGGPGRTVTPQHTVQTCTSPACVQTASSILTRMNISADPCNDFYNYACGGYVTTTRLSWNHARRREIPDDVVERYETYLMDRLSSDLWDKDDATENHLKLIYRSCLFRPRQVDNETVASVESVVTKLGGLALDNDTLEGSTDLTTLLADVTRKFGASPFFKLIVRDSNTISIINKYSDPLVASLRTLGEEVGNFLYQPPSDFYFSKNQDAYRRGFVRAAASLLGLQMIHDVRQVLNDVFSFHLELHKTLYSEDLLETGEDLLKGPCYSHLTPATLQEQYPGYLIDWQAFLRKALSRTSLDDVSLCRVSLNTNVQNVLRSTPKFVVKRYIILHALLHSDLTRMLPAEVKRWLPGKSPPPSLQVDAGSVTDEEERECVRLMVLYEAVPGDCGPGLGVCGGSVGCGEGGLGDLQRRATIDSVANSISLALQSLLARLFSVSPSSADIIVSSHVTRLSRVLLAPVKPSLPAAPPSGRKFMGNVVALLEHHQGRYHRGEVTLESTLLHNQAIRHMLRCPRSEAVLGPVGFPFASPPPVHSASLGSLLASRVAENFAIEDLLDHYAEDVLNHSAVITLALRLQCLADFYSSLGPHPEQGLGQTTRSINWQDHFSLLLAFEAWKNFIHANQGVVHLPGLDFPNDRLFFLLYSQTMCEKVGQRGVAQHYNDKGQLPVKLRVNGLMMNFREFPSAFNCPKGARMNPTDKCSIL